MDYNLYGFSKRQSISEGTPYSKEHPHGTLGDRQAGFHSQPQFALPTFNSLPRRSAYYETHYPLYYSDWTNIQGNSNDYVALSSYSEDSTNKVQIVKGIREINERDDEDIQFSKTGEVSVNYPVTKLQWDPQVASGRSYEPKLATSSECLRLYEYHEEGEISQLVETAILSNPKNKSFHQLPPMTSMDWCSADPSYIITCSIDTTCTLWDVSKGAGVAKTQLIAHDSEVFDVQFLHNSQNLFASCGNDGSVRLFDLRCLDRSTIIYEPHAAASSGDHASSSSYNKRHPLLRISASNYNQNHITAIEANSNRLVVLDLRYAGSPIRILDHHAGNINSVKWHPYKNFLLTVGDDCQAFIYDFNALEGSKPLTTTSSSNSLASGNSLKRVHTNGESDMPIMAYSDTIELNNATWSSKGDWVGLVGGKGFQAVKVDD